MTSVALVDDHELLRTGLAAIINSFEGFKVVMEANNGKQFIEKVKAENTTRYRIARYNHAPDGWL